MIHTLKNTTNSLIITSLSIALCLYALPASSKAEQKKDYYVSATYAVPFYTRSNIADQDKNVLRTTPINFDFSIGKKVSDHYRLELSTGYRKFYYNYNDRFLNKYSLDMSLKKLMLNHYVDFPEFSEHFAPYIMGGIGLAHINRSAEHTEYAGRNFSSTIKPTNNFAYQFGVGIDVSLTESVNLDLSTRYFNPGTIKFKDDGAAIKFSDIEMLVGLRYKF